MNDIDNGLPNQSALNQRLASLSPERRALLMQQLARQAPAVAKPEIGRRLRPSRLPLSFAQQRLWILDQLEPNSSAYNVTSTMRLQGRPDVDLLARAFSEIVLRHESLRTVMARDDDGPYQRILPAVPLTIAMHDVGPLPPGDREQAAFALARIGATTPFDLARGPLLRAMLVRLDDEHHLFVLNAHHIAVDGWSLGIVYDELAQLYAAFQAGQSSPLPELPIQYADYALWQREHLDSDASRVQLDYWQQRFATPPPLLELPGDRPRPPVQSHRGAVLRRVLPAELYDAVKQLSRKEGVTAFMAFLAAFQTLLARYSAQDDLVIGVGIANRRLQELETLVGFFVNTLAVRGDLSGNPTFRELLARIKEATLGAYSNQDLPIERLIETLDLDRSLSHSPLFQAMLFFQNFPATDTQLPGLTLSPVDFDAVNSGTARADLTLFASEDEGALALFFEYATDLFDEATIDGFARHLQQLLRSAVADPGRRLAELDILPAEERRQLLRDWNATAQPLPAQPTVHALFEAQATRTPDAIAVEQAGTTLSYAQLDAQANALAQQLVARGVGVGDLVGLFVERAPRMLVALLGVLKAGAAYVPIDPAYPADRIVFMLQDAAARVVVSERALQAQLPAGTCEVVLVEDAVATPHAEAVGSAADGEDVAYVIFTSGSTGRPKGVQVPHRAALNFLAAMAREPGLDATDTVCAITTLSFDIALLELLLPLTVGARIALADRATANDGVALARLLDSAGATVLQATPATWRMLLDAGWTGRPTLRMLSGGEALTRELAERLLRCGSQLWNMYGPTETTVWSTVQRVHSGDGAVAIGRPIANTQVYVVDGHLQPVPAGVSGELLIGGLGVARGYLARPELTADRFIADPFGVHPGGRLYRTGDLARWRRDGQLEVLGRLDHQVKLRGFRIELGEIEAVLASHPAVAQVVVLCREDRPGDKRLVAYVVAVAGATDASGLRAFARAQLPEYMLPSAFVALAQLPLTPNGKIDRRALPAPDASARDDVAFIAPRNAEEEALAQLWADVLGVDRVGVHDNFFDLGGHSLLATQLITRVQKTFGGVVALRVLFEAPTLGGFAERLMTQRMESIDSAALTGMLDQLEGLSDDELMALLASEALPE